MLFPSFRGFLFGNHKNKGKKCLLVYMCEQKIHVVKGKTAEYVIILLWLF